MAMSNRTAKFVSAIFASILAGANFVAVAEDGAKTADSCLSGPKGTVPTGSHWYYRIDHASKRHCWYIGEEKDKTARAAPRNSSSSSSTAASENPVPPQQNANVRKSIADARAELPSPQARVEPDVNVNVQPLTNGAVPATGLENSQRAVAPDAGTQSSLIASRWPDTSGASSSDNLRTAAADPPASLPANANAEPQPAVTPVALAAADSSLEKQSGSIQMLLMVMAGALALAGLTASVIFRFGRARVIRPEIRGGRRAIWDSVDIDRSSPSMYPGEDVPIWRAEVPHDPRAPDDPDRRVKEMLSRLARSAQA
jgi:hypothetical protein